MFAKAIRLIRPSIIFLAPLLASPLLFCAGTKEAKCGWVTAVMSSYWLTECLPMPITSLLPLVLFPWLDIMSTSTVATAYTKSTTMVALGGLILAVGIEACNLHRRAALKILLILGTNNQRLVIGCLVTSCFLSMWLSNTSTAVLMVPVVEAVVSALQSSLQDPLQGSAEEDETILFCDVNSGSCNNNNSSVEKRNDVTIKVMDPSLIPFRRAMFLSIAYGANIGGIGTLTGTGPNLVLKGIMEELYPESREITFASWMFFGVPTMILCACSAAFVLYVTVLRGSLFQSSINNTSSASVLRKHYEELGPMSFREMAVLSLFLLLKLSWFFKNPGFMKGWGPYVNTEILLEVADSKENIFEGIGAHVCILKHLSGATLVLTAAVLLFVVPSDPRRPLSGPRLLDWTTAKNKMHWGVVLILGGGFALAEGFKHSGLSDWLVGILSSVFLPLEVLCLSLCILTATLTEFTSNVVTATVLLPLVGQLGVSLEAHPLYLMLPVTISSSFAFVLPAATPPNAIVFQAAGISPTQTLVSGLLLNLLCTLTVFGTSLTLGEALFGLSITPSWAIVNRTSSDSHKWE